MHRTRVYLARLLRGSAGAAGTLLGENRSMDAQLGTPSLSTRVVGGLEGTASRLEPSSNSLLNHGGPEPLYRQAGRAAVVGAVATAQGARVAGRAVRDATGRLAGRAAAAFRGDEEADEDVDANLA
ncbi:hypothetical protein [Halospeciosus flavus]|uniref:Uncharacterized protein n=1 Tax=Halospeciosus flavus TaxID=3032283 RepID=A0ABD5Z1J4_9EURY|nr:hypothetical protein [Halospeciosus flavus]